MDLAGLLVAFLQIAQGDAQQIYQDQWFSCCITCRSDLISLIET